MSRKLFFGGFSLITILGLFSSCDVKDEPIIPEDTTPVFSSFVFYSIDNPSLSSDFHCDFTGKDTIQIFIPYAHTDSLVASFTGKYEEVLVDSIKQVSGQTVNNYNTPVTYTLRNEAGEATCYTFLIKGYNGLPIIELNSEDTIASKTEYVGGSVRISNCPEYGVIDTSCKVKGRGNATWRDYPKKPYKIKLDTKESLFGFPANKDWVLLAEYCDKSLMRTVFMCEISKAVGLEYTVHYQPVDLTLNGVYQGTYVLTDQVEKAKNRVNFSDDGFLIEDDTYYDYEPLWFTSDLMGYNYTFKYPNADKGNIVRGDDNYSFIKSYVDNLERALLAIPDDCETYKKFIDIDSFAKWFVAAEVMGNWEPNLYYVLPSKQDKLKMYPMWDAEWSLGLASKGNDAHPYGWFFPPFEPTANVDIWKNRKYFEYLFKDPEFEKAVKDNWNSFVTKIPEVKTAIKNTRDSMVYSQKANFELWDILDKYVSVGLIALGSWDAEVDYAFSFLDRRIDFMNSHYGSDD